MINCKTCNSKITILILTVSCDNFILKVETQLNTYILSLKIFKTTFKQLTDSGGNEVFYFLLAVNID